MGRNWILTTLLAGSLCAVAVVLTSRQAEASRDLTLVGKIGAKAADGPHRLAFSFYDANGEHVYRVVADAEVSDGSYAALIPADGLRADMHYRVLATIPSEAAPARAPQLATPLVMLQPSSPGSAQVGNINIDGKVLAGEGLVATASAGPAVEATSTLDSGVAGVFQALGASTTAITASGTYQGVFATAGAGSGWSPSFPGNSAIVADSASAWAMVAKTSSDSAIVGNLMPGSVISWFFSTAISGVSTSDRAIAGTSSDGIWGVVGTDSFGSEGHYRASSSPVEINHGYLANGSNGVVGIAESAQGNGLLAECNNGTSAYGIWGRSTSGYAGVFSGHAWVTNNFYAGAKFFRIDHPQDPENKYLLHACVESNEQLIMYRGTAKCDARGEATVELPAYYDSIAVNPSYHLTCVGGFAQVYVASEGKNKFKIAGGRAGLRVSWLVQAERNDPYARAHPMVVEPFKSDTEVGLLSYPREYGYPQNRGITYAKEQMLGAMEHPRDPGMRTIASGSK